MLYGFQVNLGKAWVDHVTPGWGEDEVGEVTLTMADCANLTSATCAKQEFGAILQQECGVLLVQVQCDAKGSTEVDTHLYCLEQGLPSSNVWGLYLHHGLSTFRGEPIVQPLIPGIWLKLAKLIPLGQ